MTDYPEMPQTLLRFSVAYLVIFLLFFVNVQGPSLLSASGLGAPLFLMAVYYWSAYRPTLVPLWFVFFMGLLLDLLSGAPIGLNALVLVMVRWLVTDQRLFLTGQPFLIVWIGFFLVSVATILCQWFLMGALNLYWPPVQQAGIMIGLGAALFPVVSILLHATHTVLPERPGGNRRKKR
ncbi:MAG: rod shape-determining protein MreD [Alphaproteobacteria bacterium]|jgi:rod shape-determining protein MreD|nr:rod shape-determining protein MreD [Alphaproteobacteria bacterium]QQS58327.1 MAG: rod shape-determining protein MreD [Alphaproteobacteria bacterium]